MEHCYVTSAENAFPYEVPCVANQDYLGIPFQDYFRRVCHIESLDDLKIEEVDSIFQTCFFFSFLQEVIGDSFRHSDYVSEALNNKGVERSCVTAAKLSDKLMEWSQKIRQNPTAAKTTYSHFQDCVRMSDSTFYKLSRRVTRSILLSTTTFLETAAREIMDASHTRFVGLYTKPASLDSELLWMSKKGSWCPFEAASLWSGFISAGTLIFLLSIAKPQQHARHLDCSVRHCYLDNSDPADYIFSHTSESCDCTCWRPNINHIKEAIQRGQTPVILAKFGSDSSLASLDSVGIPSTTDYMAVSHVWTDGLGNPHFNGVLTCQLHRLVQKIYHFACARSGEHKPELCIWLDTLCVPIEPLDAKLQALSRMKHIYEEATDVLVLDSDIEAHEYTSSTALLSAMMVCSSRWTLRLWTLQEGITAKQLWIFFSDVAVEIEDLRIELSRQASPAPYIQKIIAVDLWSGLFQLRGAPHTKIINVEPYSMFDLQHAVRRRLVSIPSDEPLCLANIMGFTVAAEEDVPGRRMSLFWAELIQKKMISSCIIFAHDPGLQVKGYRWAPATLLQAKVPEDSRVEHHFPKEIDQYAVLHPDGISVRYPGVKLKVRGVGKSGYRIIRESSFPGWDYMFVHDRTSKQWYFVYVSDYNNNLAAYLNDGPDCSVILELGLPNESDTETRALLVALSEGAHRKARTVARCTVHWIAQPPANNRSATRPIIPPQR